jgi:hypothetical protein
MDTLYVMIYWNEIYMKRNKSNRTRCRVVVHGDVWSILHAISRYMYRYSKSSRKPPVNASSQRLNNIKKQ